MSNNTQKEEALRYDEGKPDFTYLDPSALEGLCKVLEYGDKKYTVDDVSGRNNWKKGMTYSKVIRSLLRHTFKLLQGEFTDPESGLQHIDHIGANWMFLSYYMKNREDLDDLSATKTIK